MTERVAYVGGRIVPESQAAVSIFDRVVLSGHGVYERTRTFRGEPFRLGAHLDRLERSLRATGLTTGLSRDELERITLEVLGQNRGLLGPDDDYSIGHFITRGPDGGRPNVIIFCEPIRFASFARQYLTGWHVVVVSTRALPTQVLDPKIKAMSRMHMWLAQQEAQLVDPEAYPLLLDLDGNVCELSAANFWIVRKGAIITPPGDSILGGVTREVVVELAADQGIAVESRWFQPYDVFNADEAFLTSTTPCVLPITRIDGRPIGDGRPGPVVGRLQKGWAERHGMDFVALALRHLEGAALSAV
jgi:branched-chain amino acid aminotransferase